MKKNTLEQYGELCLRDVETQKKRNSQTYPARFGVSIEKKLYSDPVNVAESAMERGLVKYDLVEVENSRKIVDTKDLYQIEIMVDRNK